MFSMKPLLYRVETYIVPDVNKFPTQKISSLDDGTPLTCQPGIIDENMCEKKQQNPEDTSSPSYGRRKYVKSMEYFVRDSDCKSTDIKSMESVMSNREIVYDEQPENNDFNYQNDEENLCTHIEKYFDIQKMEYQTLTKSHDSFYPVRQFKRFNSLISIDEKSESSSNADSKMSDFCQHGFKNGCTATIPSPEEVSGEIFQENWLRKIEALRQREAAVAEKEINLQNRERQLFNREKEIRIRERSLQDKQRQIEHEQKQQDLQNVNRRLQEVGQKLMSEFQESQEKDHSLEGGRNSVVQVNEFAKTEKLRDALQLVDSCERIKELEKKPRNMTRSKNYLSKQSSSNRLNSYSSMRFKKRAKESNDDLNSTLSADPGDSSFVKTSERFNPEAYKKPYAFMRSASERWDKQKGHKIVSKVQTVLDTEEKVLRKLTENIHATQDKDTKFQDYGLVDCRLDKVPAAVPNPERNPANEEKFSYLDLATNKKAPERRQKDRPISWNEKTNDWLQKKRQAYNLATKESLENKENLQCNNVTTQRTKSSKKAKNKIFTMFR